ncbi:MAG: isoprenoid biosynthesis protein ElbB [Magnetococcales bacterium]|nr:isoprenoid biosynthesis protein ElbB [Magnetococcales bacterium]
MSQKIAVILSGCGVFDGSEIYEATLTLLHIKKNGYDYECLAPNIDQHHVINHLTGEEVKETHNVLVESARLARGEVKDIATANASDYAAVILPGGFGAAKNLSNFAFESDNSKLAVEANTLKFLNDAKKADLPLGFICITPASVAAIAFKGAQLRLTIGKDADTAARIEDLGNIHQETSANHIVVDSEHGVTSTAAYMCGNDITEIELGISKLVSQVTADVLAKEQKAS